MSSSVQTQSRLGICEVCAKDDAKYSCPRCEVKTCSLRCYKTHKLEVECNGQRDRTKFIPLNMFTHLDLASDYRLLEEVSRVVEVSKKGRTKASFALNKRFVKLQEEAMNRKITLKFLPKSFVRHKQNSSWFNESTKSIEWHIDWFFVNSDNLKITERNVPEKIRLRSVLQKYLFKQVNRDFQEKLQYYQAVDLPGIKILLKAEQKSGIKFYEIDPTHTLKECFKNKIIIEYPVIYLVLKNQVNFYDIIDSDDEDGKRELKKQIKSGQEVVNKIIKKSERENGLNEPLKNLMFVSESSDEAE